MAEGTVVIKGRAELGEINRAVDKVAKKVERVDREAKKARVSLQDTGRALTALGAAAAVGGAAIGALVSDTLNARLEMANLANTAGVTAPTFAALAQAAELAGRSSDQLVGGLAALGSAAFDAAQGNAEAATKFSDLGVSVTDAGGQLRSTEEIFRDVLQALGEIPNEAERTARAQKLMGEAAGTLKASLGELSTEGFEAAQRKAHAFTRGLTEEGLDAAAKYEAAMTKLDAIMRSVGDAISDDAGPAFNTLVDALVYVSTFVSEVFNQTMETLGKRLLLTVEAVEALGPILTKVFAGDLRGAYQEAEKANEAIKNLRESMGLGLIPVVDDLGPIMAKAALAAELMRRRMDEVHDSTRDMGEQSKRTGHKIKSLTDEMDEFVATLEYGAGSTVQVLEPLNEQGGFLMETFDGLTSSVDDFVAAYEAPKGPIISDSDLAGLQQFGEGFESVMGLVDRAADVFAATGVAAEDMTDAQKAAALKAFQVQKAAALATAVVNTAVGMTQALAGAPPPLSFINAALVAASGGLSIAEIASQQPPSFAAGGVMPSTGGAAILHPGEGVLSAGAVDSLGGVSALDSLNSRSAMSNGGAVVVQWKHLRQSFAYEARDAGNRPGPLRDIRRDGRRAGQMRRAVRADYGSL